METATLDTPQGEKVPEAHAARPYEKFTQFLHWGALCKGCNHSRVEEEGAMRPARAKFLRKINEVMMKGYHVSVDSSSCCPGVIAKGPVTRPYRTARHSIFLLLSIPEIHRGASCCRRQAHQQAGHRSARRIHIDIILMIWSRRISGTG